MHFPLWVLCYNAFNRCKSRSASWTSSGVMKPPLFSLTSRSRPPLISNSAAMSNLGGGRAFLGRFDLMMGASLTLLSSKDIIITGGGATAGGRSSPNILAPIKPSRNTSAAVLRHDNELTLSLPGLKGTRAVFLWIGCGSFGHGVPLHRANRQRLIDSVVSQLRQFLQFFFF